MRIVDRTEFLSLPQGTVYSEFSPIVFDGLFVKASGAGAYLNDWLYDDLIAPVECNGSDQFADILLEADADSNKSFPLDFEYTGRDGTFEKDQKFAVYELDDVRGLIARLSECLVENLKPHPEEEPQ